MTEQANTDPVQVTEGELLSLQEVTHKIGCSRRSVYNFMRTRGFPKPVTVGRPRWDAAEVEAWLASELQRSELPTAPT